MKCSLCPRKCNIDRQNDVGFCGVGDDIIISRAAPHFWEEPCVSGKNGSGTVFFSGCSLQCVFCQNYKISRASFGKKTDADGLLSIFKSLEDKGCHNINLVTADHYIPRLLPILKKADLKIPFALNTSSYLTESAVKSLEGTVDIFIADFKFFDPRVSQKYANAPDYPEVCKKAISQMVTQAGSPVIEDGIMKRGVIVRVLVLPDNIIDAKRTLKYLYSTYGDDIIISIMSQYTPVCDTPYPELARRLTDREYKSVVDFAMHLGIKNCFIQAKDSADADFIPEFYNA